MPPKKKMRAEKGQVRQMSMFESLGLAKLDPTTSGASDEKKDADTISRSFRQAWISEFQPWLR